MPQLLSVTPSSQLPSEPYRNDYHHTANTNFSHHRSHNQEDNFDDMSAFTTQFNVTALVPSVRRAYVDLWDTIELVSFIPIVLAQILVDAPVLLNVDINETTE